MPVILGKELHSSENRCCCPRLIQFRLGSIFNMSLVQYVILRKDLQTILNWPLGALIAQACHATSAVLHMYQDDENTRAYLAKLDSMHKVVLQVPDAESLTDLAGRLSTKNIDFKLWIEEPENIPTCIAIKPYPRNAIKPLVKEFKLFS